MRSFSLSNAFFLFARRYFSLFLQFFQFDQITVSKKVAIVSTVRQKNNKNGPCREVTVKEEVDVSSEVRPRGGGGTPANFG